MFQGIQRRPDGAGPPVEIPVNAAQGVNNANLDQSRSPLPINDPFMDTAPVGHQFDRSALGLYGDEGDVMYSFGGLQQSGTTNQMCHAHQFESSPPAGYNPHSAPFSEPGSRGHSIPPATPMIVETSGIPGITGCYQSEGSVELFIPFLLLFAIEFELLLLTLIRAIQSWRTASSALYMALLKHNVFYYACGLFFSALNIFASLVLKVRALPIHS
ncbi:hypothetical protein AZE42_06230 [Rhizopogon vesiculosus]|uniref:Uncharacterized protein n=1 Tax=Rhizopogon vesiculosus TaxID=180088 RepID=A0A1J8Q114_9AGAM|nr:hypothetical protein AZE42_06230 [Rhizopogon vesiculosus]